MLINLQALAEIGCEPHKVLHIGAHTAEEAAAYDAAGCEVMWVEAQKHLADDLWDRGLNVIHAAIWSERTTIAFYETSNGQSSSLLPLGTHLEHYPNITVTKTYVVDTITIDDLNVKPDFLNLDIQGAELNALKGATRTLESVKWIYTEFSIESLYEGQPLESELTAWLEKRGFTQSLRVLTEHGWGDSLYVRSSLHGDH